MTETNYPGDITIKPKNAKTVITKTGVVYDTVFILIFLWGASRQFFAPESFLGRTIDGFSWTLLFGIVLALIGGMIVVLLEKAGYPTTREVHPGDEQDD